VHSEWEDGYFAFDSPVTIRLKDGTIHEKVCVDAKGDPSQRLSSDEVTKKYMDCMDFANTFSRETVERAADMTLSLDRLEDVSELVELLTFPDK
jgi:hypothetical protein